jgi:flagellin-like protein
VNARLTITKATIGPSDININKVIQIFKYRNQNLFKGYIMKGISPIIATILMLMITIALAGTAYMYISGVFTGRTAVVLSVSSADCNSTHVNVYVKNDGTLNSSAVTVSVDGSGTGTCNIPLIVSGGVGNCAATRPASFAGYHTVRATPTTGSPATGTTYCAT